MATLEEAKMEYFSRMKAVLHDHPEELRTFTALWGAENFSEAYVFATRAIENYRIILSDTQKKASGDFFWRYIY